MKRILCPTDFSPTAHDAIAYAAKLAQAVGAELLLLNVQSVFDVSAAEVIRGNGPSVAGAAERLEEQCKEISKTFRISCYAEVEAGFTRLSTVISNKAKTVDLIVMGTNGADDFYQFFSGSNTYNAIIKSETPLLLIPAGYVYSEIRTMVYAFDYLKERDLPLAHLVPLVEALKCKLTVLQVMEEAYSKEAEDDLNELQFIIKTLHGDDLNYRFDTIRSSEIAQSINSYILRNQPDVLALCSVHRNMLEQIFHKSIIKNISAVCNYPVFVFHQ